MSIKKQYIPEETPHVTPYFPFQALSQTDHCGQYFAPYHWHDEVEFLCVTKGTLRLCTDRESYLLEEGHVYFINPGTVHGIFGHSLHSHHYALLFPLDLLSFSKYDICQNEFLSPLLMGKLLFPDGRTLSQKLTKRIGELMTRASLLYQDLNATPAPLSIKILLLEVLELLFSHNSFVQAADIPRDETRGIYPLKPVFTYIETHYSEKITLEELSASVHMNKNYFCRFFKEKAGKTPFSYLTEYRINQSCSQLLNTSLPITEIALNTGFENMSYFIRQFRRYRGCTPSEFRRSES